MPGGVNRQGIGVGDRVLDYDIYTVYKSVGLGMGAVAADLHDTAQIICNNITYLRDTILNTVQFERC